MQGSTYEFFVWGGGGGGRGKLRQCRDLREGRQKILNLESNYSYKMHKLMIFFFQITTGCNIRG